MRRLAAMLLAIAAPLHAQEARPPESTISVGRASQSVAASWMVVAAHPLAAEAGRAILAKGGSAADAAVAVQAMLNVVEPQSSGIGGGAFALYWDAATRRLTSFDARETAPLAADETYWLGPDGEPVAWWDAVVGGRSVGVPGALKLMETLHERFGRTPWADLLAPAIATAARGFEISPRLAGAIAEAKEDKLDLFPAARTFFFNTDGSPKAEGTVLRNPDLAETLRLIAAEGAAPFYAGAIADDIVAAVRTEANPGILTREDLARYRVVERAPVCVAYRVHEVCGMGPPSSGGMTVAQILGMLESFDLPAMGPGPAADHLFIEAAKLAYADRDLYIADSDFVRMPKGLLNRAYLAERSRLIDPDAVTAKATAGAPPWDEAELRAPQLQPERPGTSHFVIRDAQGNAISMTTSIETGFGSRVMTRGFLLNNQLTDFSRAPAADGAPIANRVEGGKRPRSSMAPTIVLRDGAPELLIGSPGGSRIITYVARATIAILDWGMSPAEAVAMPHVVNRNGATEVEEGPEAEARAAALRALGHEVKIADLNSGLHALLIGPDGLTGAADPRREGVALGE